MGSQTIGFVEKFLERLLLLALVGLHVVYAFVFRLDSDEPQHLHVVWGWTQGQLPYRDFFDNHSPLFSWLYSPVLRVLGERADIIPWMRLTMIPLWAICLACVYRLGERLFSRRAGSWAAVAAGFFPLFFYTSTEFRADNLWTMLWLVTLTVLLTGRFGRSRLFYFGLALGTTFATSMKTTLLAGSLLLAALVILSTRWQECRRVPARIWVGRTVALVGGLILVPGAFVVFFALHGAWQPFVYCLITHNTLPGMADGHGWRQWRPLLFPLALPGLWQGARYLLRQGKEIDFWRVQRIFFLLAALGYPLLLVSFWPLLTSQDYLPAIPPLALVLAAAIFSLADAAALPRDNAAPLPRTSRPLLPVAVAVAVVGTEIALIFFVHGPWRNRTGPEQKLLSAVLRLTSPGDTVMDDKGEAVYRQRPFYYALETITRERLNRGLIADDFAERLIAARTTVVRLTFLALPRRARAFIRANYVPVGPLSVLGKTVELAEPTPGSPSHRYLFPVAVPARYVILDAAGIPVAGRLDGQTLDGRGQWIAAGSHAFETGETGPLTVFWARAYNEGFLPCAGNAIEKLYE